jgi:hypothetical protein
MSLHEKLRILPASCRTLAFEAVRERKKRDQRKHKERGRTLELESFKDKISD